MHRRFAVLLLAGGCRQLLGLDDPTAAPLPEDAPQPSLDTAPDAQKFCPSDYVAVGSSHYRFVETRARWLDAVQLCADDHRDGPPFTHLVVIGNDAERQALLPLRSLTNDAYWIGLTDLAVPGTWQWVTAEPTNGYPGASGAPWSANQPMNGDCAVIVGPMYGLGENGMFYSDYCKTPATVNLPYICECDGYADDPARH